MKPKKYSVQHWYAEARGWSEYFATDNLAEAYEALQTADPPDVGIDEYDRAMHHYRLRNRRRIYDIQENRALEEYEPDLRYVIGHKLLIWGMPLGATLILLSSCGK